MSNVQIVVDGVSVTLRTKANITTEIDKMTAAYAKKLKAGKVKGNSARLVEMATLSFFGSISHYLKGGSEA